MGAIQYAERQKQTAEKTVETTANETVEQVENPQVEEIIIGRGSGISSGISSGVEGRSLWARIMSFFTSR